jgi:hypothetical protein
VRVNDEVELCRFTLSGGAMDGTGVVFAKIYRCVTGVVTETETPVTTGVVTETSLPHVFACLHLRNGAGGVFARLRSRLPHSRVCNSLFQTYTFAGVFALSL